MKIAVFTDSLVQNNGLARHVREVSKRLAKDHEVVVVTGRGSLEGVEVINLPHFPFFFDKNYDVIIPKSLKLEVDVVHAHSPLCTSRIAFKQEAPVVTTTHTLPVHFFSCIHAGFLEPVGWRVLVAFHNKSNHVVCQTMVTEKLFEDHGMNRPVSVISTGIDFESFRKASDDLFRNEFGVDGDFVLMTNRLSPEKKPRVVLEACRKAGVPLVVLSDGPLRKKLEKEYSEFLFMGFVSDELMKSALKAARFTVTASGFETEGISVVESLAAGTPVIAYNLPVLVEVTEGNALFFSSEEELVNRVKILWGDDGLLKKLKKKGVETAKNKDYSVVVKELEVLYSSLAEGVI